MGLRPYYPARLEKGEKDGKNASNLWLQNA
jgi:hypothetical protein